MRQNVMRSLSFTVVCIILGILIALQMKNVNMSNITANNLTELQNKLIEYNDKNAELSNRNAELYEYITLLENGQASGNAQIEAIIREKERAAIFAGLREARNSGVAIRVSCAEGMDIRDSVLRQFVNEVRALGAQAISINGERLVAMSEIRASGSSIIINGNPYSRQAPFEILAIMNPANEASNLRYLGTVKTALLADPVIQNEGYDIQFDAMPEVIIPALSEDSIAFKIDLLMPRE